MFNGYNDSPLISYEFNQEREKKSDNVSKYSYGHDGGVQSTSTHPNNRQSEFWSGKPNFIGIPNVVKCNCTGCYPTTENHSYQVESTRHRPWLPKTFSVPLNGSNECKLPPYQWDSALNQICYSDPNVPCGQENGGKHAYYRQFQTPNQPGVIISANKQKKEVGFQNDIKQPVMCNPGYDFTKRVNGRSYYDGDKYSLGAHSMNQTPRLPVEPYTKAVPSNLNQNRVPSTGHRKENSPQYDHYGGTKVYAENYHPGLSPMDLKNSGIHVDYSYFNRDPDFYRNNYTEIKRNNLAVQNLKDCAVTQGNLEQHYGRSKYPENLKGCEMFYPNLEKNQMESCIQKIESDGMNRLPRSVMVCNDLLYADERSQAYPYQNDMAYRNYVRPEYSHFNSQYVPGFQETDKNQCRTLPQQLQSFDQHPQSNSGCIVDIQKDNLDKTQSRDRSQLVADAQSKPNYLESIRSEELTKNGTNKISPLRLLRKKKFTTAPQELSSTTSTSETPMLDVRKFWSTWAEEDENVSPTQMVVLDCQNIDPEQAKLLDFYETDSSRAINLENVILKNPDFVKNNIENVKSSEQPVEDLEKQIENPTQMERIIKNTDEVLSELEAFNISPKKYRCQEYRKKKMDEVMDKWTEKKFDFLKRSEECKAAEIIKYEEEKKKIFEQRLSFQQSLNKIEKQQDGALRCEENSQRNYPEERITSNLPTSEYRRNKFLDYSEVIANGCKENLKIENKKANQSTEPVVKKEEPDVKHETDSTLEMNDILKKISEINFQEMKLESDLETTKKVKKTKKKKIDQRESDARTDLKLETASKPTIKFSIQKSHDLKISFKVLNKNYEEEIQSEEIKPIENVNTELITLKYKSIQSRDKLSDSKKRRGKLRRKKRTPVLKIKKSRKSTEEERDPLAEDDEAKTYPTDGFQVQETVDSAKIKLTFKRHKTNMETEYKVDNESLDAGFEEREKNVEAMVNRYRKKSKKAKKQKIFPPVDIESSQLEPKSTEQDLIIADCSSECTYENRLESTKALLKKSIHSSPCPIDEEEEENQTTFGMTSPEKQLCELSVENDVMEDTKLDGEEQVDLIVNRDGVSGSNDKRDKFSPDENVGDAISKSSEKTKEEIQEISLDFIRSINSPDIETNRETEKTEGIEGRHATEGRNKNGALIESTNENHSNLESSYDLKKNSDCLEMAEFGKSTSLGEVNASPKSDSYENFDADVIEKDENGTENEIFIPEANCEEHSSPKPPEDNFEKHDLQQEKSEDFGSEFGKNIESEIPKVLDSKSETEFEDIVIKIVEADGSENDSKSSKENAKSESDGDRDCEQVDVIDTINDEEHSEFSEITPHGALPPNGNLQQSKMGAVSPARLSEDDDKGVESNQTIIKEGDVSAEPFGGQNSGNETKSDSESQNIELRKFEDEESKSSVKDQEKDDEERMFLMESEFDNSTGFEKEDKFYDANKVCGDRFSCMTPTYRAESERIESDDATNRRSAPSEKMSFTEEVDVDFGNHSVNENCDCGTVENLNQKVELINVENVPQSSDIDHLIHIADLIDEGSCNATEEDAEVIWDSKNISYNESATEVVSLSRTVEFDEDLNRSYVTEKDEPEVGFNLSVCDSQNSSEVEIKDCSQLAKVQQKGREADHFTPGSLDSTGSGIVPDICNRDDFPTCEGTRIDDARDSLEVVKHSEDGEEKPDKEDELFLNDKRTILLKAQENTITIENENRANGSSPVDLSRVNSTLTDPTTIKSNDETDFVKNSSPRVNEFEWNCLELASNQESELEDGEIVDGSSDESEHAAQTSSDVRKIVEFKIQKPIRRHSIYLHNTESPALHSWCQKRFVKSKSCPPRLELRSFELQANVSVKDIPLPVGPAPLNSCFGPGEVTQEMNVSEEAKEKPKQVPVALPMNEKETAQELPCGSPFGAIELRNCRNPSPPHSDALGPHRSKIKFSLTKRSRFSKVGLHSMKPKLFEISEPVVKAPIKNMEPKVTEVAKKPDVIKNSEKPDLRVLEISKKFHVEIAAPEKIQENIFRSAEKAETEAVEPTGMPKIGELFERSESKAVELPEIVEPETYIENLKLEIIETDISISNQTNTHGNKIRTPDYVSERVEEISECQIAEVPNSHPTHADGKDQKSDPEVESLCEDANVEIVDVMDDFMRDKFYEDIPTSEDLPEGDSLDEKVNDDKFRNIMQNCLENAKKFLNVGNLKLFSCSVDDLLELDNQENEPAAKHISRDVLLTSCEDTNDDLGLNGKFQPVDISMEFIPSDVCPEILPVDNWPYLEEEVPSSPLKSNETDLILENTISEVIPSRKRAAKESDNHKRFRRKSLIDDEDTPYSKVAAHRRKTIDGSNSFLSYAELNGIDKPNESLKCRLSLDKLTKNGVEFIGPQSDIPKKMKSIQTSKKLNYKSSLWQPKVMLIRISESEMKRFKNTKIYGRFDENVKSLPSVKKQKSDDANGKGMENKVVLTIPAVDSIKGLITTSTDVKKHKPRFRNLHTKRKPDQGQSRPKAIETALSELFKDCDEEPKNVKFEKTSRSMKNESKVKSDRHSSKHSSHDHEDRRRDSERENHRHKEKHKHERSRHEEGKRHRSGNSDDDRRRSLSKNGDGQKEAKETWTCEVCGFNDASERVAHIKNHPFHCQSCHLAFKTEAYFTSHLTEMHKDIRNQHHCLLCELSFDTEEEYQRHLETREHTHLEAVEKNTINTLFTLLTGAPCPVLGLVEMKPEWLPNQSGTVHFYHQATPLSLALQYLKMHRDLTSYSEVSKVQPN